MTPVPSAPFGFVALSDVRYAAPAISTWTHGFVTKSAMKTALLISEPSRPPELTMSACAES